MMKLNKIIMQRAIIPSDTMGNNIYYAKKQKKNTNFGSNDPVYLILSVIF